MDTKAAVFISLLILASKVQRTACVHSMGMHDLGVCSVGERMQCGCAYHGCTLRRHANHGIAWRGRVENLTYSSVPQR